MKTITIDGSIRFYNDIRHIRDFFKDANITIANHVELGDHVVLHRDIVLETAVKIGYRTEIGTNVRVGTDTKIGDKCFIGNNVTIMTCGKIGDNVTIENNLIIGEENTIHSNTHLQYSKHIKGTVATVTYTGNHRICIGCVDFSIDYWKEHSKEIGKKWKYTDKQIEEYEGYIIQIEEFLKQLN